MDISNDLRHKAANAIRFLSIDAVNKANSGHPGAPMGMADIAVVLWAEIMKFDPKAPTWQDRDRFILSNGHGSMLLYSMLHLSGYEVSMDDIKNFRCLHSITPGHPEYGMTPGVETTTGPLGQGFATGVGMALAERMAKARFNQSGADFQPVDHYIYAICGDGCLMEGISAEAASIAGQHGLGELIYIFDDNKITIDGSTDISFNEDVEKRFLAHGWDVSKVDGHDQAAIKSAVLAAQKVTDKPSLIMARTHIGFGSPNKQDTSGAHGSPLGADEAQLTREKLGWSEEPFSIPSDVYELFAAAAKRGAEAREKWSNDLAQWKGQSDLGAAWTALFETEKVENLSNAVLDVMEENDTAATRALSGKALNAIAQKLPGLVGGSADLAGSNKTQIKGSEYFSQEAPEGRNIHFGVREHAMGAAVNGMALYGGFVPYGATFLTFSDYMRPALRLAALMKIRSLTVFSHESVYLGEDGPTHQSVEHNWALRMIPGLYNWRPADGIETAMAWSYAVQEGNPAPHTLMVTRQGVPSLPRAGAFTATDVWKGGYVIRDTDDAHITIVATGSEVDVALQAADQVQANGINARVVSMPCLDLFLDQTAEYQESVVSSSIPCVSIELGRTQPWAILTGRDGLNLGVDTFGESAPWKVLRDFYEMVPEKVAEKIQAWFSKK
ncbi:MAG: transketolase [Myxococcota bacterium]|nr:transketolase [Myxococcota bacterium]